MKVYFECMAQKKVDYQSICSLSKNPGNCNNKTERWFYDLSTQKCENLAFNGCEGIYSLNV